MTFQPVVPIGGLSGWAFLNRTRDSQEAAFEASPQIKRDTDYFAEKIGAIETAEDLVVDRRLLSVALGAFGLQDDIDNRYFIRKVLEDGTLDEGALGNRLSDKRYLELSKAFGFGDFDTPNTVLSTFADEILDKYRDRAFAVAIGEANEDMRLALNVETELAPIAGLDTTENGRWFTIMGNTPLREVFQTAFGLPDSFGALDLDQQLGIFKDRAARMFGTSDPAQFADKDTRDELVRNFLVRAEINAGTATDYSPASNALQLLQSL